MDSGKICDKPLLHNRGNFPNYELSGTSPTKSLIEARITRNGWCASSGSYLIIDLRMEYHIRQVVTMGNKSQEEWGESYLLQYGHNKSLVNSSNSVKVWFNIP